MPIVRIPFSYPGIEEDVMPSIMNNYDIDHMFIWDTRAMRMSGVPQTADFQLWRADKKQEKKKLLAEEQAKKDTGKSSTDNSKQTAPGKTTRRTPKETVPKNDNPNSPPEDKTIEKGPPRKNKGNIPTKPITPGDPLLDQPSNDDDDEADEEESPICGTTAVEIERYGRELYEHRRIAVYLDDLITESESRRLRPISEEHVAKTIQMFKEFGTQELYGSISVTVHPEYFPESGDIEDVLDYSLDDGAQAKAKITFIIIDGAHRFVALNRLREDANPLYDWTRRRIPVYLTYRHDGKPLTQLEVLKNGQLLNTVSAHSLPTVEFLDVLRTVLSYAKTFDDDYNVPFIDARLKDIREDMVAASFIKDASLTKYNRFIRLAKLCRRHIWLFNFIKELNSRPPLQNNTTTVKLSLAHFANNTLETCEDFFVRFMVEGAWMALNRVHSARDRITFTPGPFYNYARAMCDRLLDYLRTIPHKCANMDDLFRNVINTKSDRVQTVYDIAMCQFRLWVDPSQRANYEAAHKLNMSRIDRIISKVQEKLSPGTEKQSSGKSAAPGTATNPIDVDSAKPLETPGKNRPKRKASKTSKYEPPSLPTRQSKRQKTSHNKTSTPSTAQTKPSATSSALTPTKITSRRSNNANDFPFYNDHIPSKPPHGYEKIFQEVQDRPEPVFNEQILRGLTIHPTVKRDEIEPIIYGIPHEKNKEKTKTTTKRTDQRLQFSDEDPTPLLRAGHVPYGHQANLFFTSTDVKFIRNLSQFWGTYAALREYGTIKAYQEDISVIPHVCSMFNTPLSMGYFSKRQAELQHRGFTILNDVANPIADTILNSPNLPFDVPQRFQRHTMTEFMDAVLETFDRDEAIENRDGAPWYTIFNHADDRDEADKETGALRFSTTNSFSVNLLNRKENVWMSRFRAMLDVYLGQICLLMGLHTINANKLQFPSSGGRFLLTGENSAAQVGHNDFEHQQPGGPGFFVMATGATGSSLWVADGSHKYVHYPEKKKTNGQEFKECH